MTLSLRVIYKAYPSTKYAVVDNPARKISCKISLRVDCQRRQTVVGGSKNSRIILLYPSLSARAFIHMRRILLMIMNEPKKVYGKSTKTSITQSFPQKHREYASPKSHVYLLGPGVFRRIRSAYVLLAARASRVSLTESLENFIDTRRVPLDCAANSFGQSAFWPSPYCI